MERDFTEELTKALSEYGLAAPPDLVGKFVAHYRLLRSWNRRVNLTRIIEQREAARLHYAESLFAAQFIEEARTILDVGSGAGFPAVPLAAARPDVEVTALEANAKKAVFLREVKAKLGLNNLQVVRCRLEDYDAAGFDLITVRALDKAQHVVRAVTTGLRSKQRLFLFCTEALLATLLGALPEKLSVRVHPIPVARSRQIAIFSRRG